LFLGIPDLLDLGTPTMGGNGLSPFAHIRIIGGASSVSKAETGPKKLSAIDAAATVMAEAGEPMDCQTMITTMLRPATTTSSVP
jgi:hypothetical protein